jgi:hypothetical protein
VAIGKEHEYDHEFTRSSNILHPPRQPGPHRFDRKTRSAVDGQPRTSLAHLRPANRLGLGAQIGAGACYALSRYNRYALLGVIVCIVLNWFGDSLDGTLARVRRHERVRATASMSITWSTSSEPSP